MPSKSRKIASRQAEIGRRKRGPKSASSGSVINRPLLATDDSIPVDSADDSIMPSPVSPTVIRPSAPSDPKLSGTNLRRAVNPYIWSEIRYIGLLSLIIFIVLGALKAILG